MAIPVAESSPEREDQQDANHGNEIEYSQISDYQPVSSDDPFRGSPDNGNGQNTHGFEPINSNGEQTNVLIGPASTTITYNGMEFHVFGNVDGLSSLHIGNGFSNGNDLAGLDTEEEEEEERLREEAEIAIREANRADMERRNAPLHPERSSAIMNAMRGISLQGFQPDWADRIPEDQWVNQLRGSRDSPSQS
eukprot:Gb_37207 [translate_table: standard]